jgi:hypothetical protein
MYTDEWIAVINGSPATRSGNVEVHKSSWDFVTGELSEVTSGMEGMVGRLQLMLGMFGDIAVYDEEALLDAARTKALTTYRYWRYDRTVSVRVGNTLQSAYYADYHRGEVIFNDAVSAGYPVLIRYHFAYFTPKKLEEILEWANGEFNLRKPVTTFTLAGLPEKFQQYVIMRAFVEAINILRLDRLMWTTRLIFANPEEVEAVLAAKSAEVRDMINTWRKPRSVVAPHAITSAKMGLGSNVQSHTAIWAHYGLWA